ncbi:hypothetical protein EDB86DRAFT_2060175 [Lactarius hatsudake]|nr:hypothetical protein EDB86DRAFT_2060175 [Lactarius hatsudake]
MAFLNSVAGFDNYHKPYKSAVVYAEYVWHDSYIQTPEAATTPRRTAAHQRVIYPYSRSHTVHGRRPNARYSKLDVPFGQVIIATGARYAFRLLPLTHHTHTGTATDLHTQPRHRLPYRKAAPPTRGRRSTRPAGAARAHTVTHTVMTEIEGEVGATPAQSVHRFFQLELAPLYATKTTAEAFARSKEGLHILKVNNAGRVYDY